ncbi:MAG TPA: adenylate/guanylate cyclase domain-containing protein, partial [Candidatus Acidoferrum sp.]|nr:adenylate/guanylate cyclase domain-containing protein [Candidatus Acidoferrum sp.]
MPELPRGTVTLLFTDIEGSTRLLAEQPDAYAEALAEHRRALREVFARHGGVEVDTQGDAFFVAFARASDAVAGAEDGQRAVANGLVRVRMGLHTGEPTVTSEGYVGLDVHRASRIAAAGHGGQILLSQSTREIAQRDDVHDLGEHRLKDLATPLRIYQLGNGEFPPLRTLFASNLPVPPTPFMGRQRELAGAEALLRRHDVRLVSMIGAGGSGKTRLALEVAAAVSEDYEHGVWWVPLSSVSNADAVMSAIGRALGGGSAAEAIGNRHVLLLLDNFEHVIAAAPEVATLLSDCRHLDVLVTSRERLSLQGEHLYPVEPLARKESVELFLARARAISPDFETDARLDELCARLDDLPLAIELAAARISLMTVDQLLKRLGGRLDNLRAGRDAEARHQTLRTTIAWSFDLLSPEERTLLAALSVFRGGWTLDASERVANANVNLLESLVDKSLVRRGDVGRFGMLDTVRDFAAEQLEPAERTRIVQRLLEHLLALFVNANLTQDATGPMQMNLASVEEPNIEVALNGAAGESRPAPLGIRLILLTEMYWVANDPVRGLEWLEKLMAKAAETPEPLEPGVEARTLRFRATALDLTFRFDLSEPEYVRSLELFRAADEEERVGHLTARIANAALRQGDVDRAVTLATESLEIARRDRNSEDEGFALYVLAMAAFTRGDLKQGEQLVHQSAPLTHRGASTWISGTSLVAAAEFLIPAGQLDQAEIDVHGGLETLSSIGD